MSESYTENKETRRHILEQYPAAETMSLNNEITILSKREGVNIIGFADLRCLSKEVRQNFDFGIVFALSYTKEAMSENKGGSPQRYHAELRSINKRLPELAAMIADLLIGRGYKACIRVSSTVVADEDHRTNLPHKTVGTLAGIGWIGKCALFVTEEVGSALRLGVVLTNAELECGTPVTKSRCGTDCACCADACPGKAVLGGSWMTGTDRDEFFNARACYSAGHARARATLGIDETVCGLCISSCPFTKRGLGYE